MAICKEKKSAALMSSGLIKKTHKKKHSQNIKCAKAEILKHEEAAEH